MIFQSADLNKLNISFALASYSIYPAL